MVMNEPPSPASPVGPARPAGDGTLTGRWINRSIDGWQWRIRADWLAFFESSDAPRWLDLAGDPRAELVKTNELRDVFRFRAPGGSLFVKIARPATRMDCLRHRVLGPDCVREWRAFAYAAPRGIATVAPVALAWRRPRRFEPASILITLEVAHAVTLEHGWPEAVSDRAEAAPLKNSIIEAVAELIARAHHGGFIHTDLHAGNILVQRKGGGPCRVCFVDLQAVSVGRQVGDGRAIRNLARFGHWFQSRARLTDRMRFLNRYLTWRQQLAPEAGIGRDRRALVRRLDRAARAHAASLAAKRDRQSLRDGRRFAVLRLDPGARAHVFLWTRQPVPGSGLPTTPLTREWWRLRLDEVRRSTASVDKEADSETGHITTARSRSRPGAPAGPPARAPANQRPVAPGREAAPKTVSRASWPIDNSEQLDVLILSHVPSGLGDRLRQSLLGSRSMRLWKDGNALLNRGIPAVRPLAVCETRRWGLLHDGFVVFERPPASRTLPEFLNSRPARQSPREGYRLKATVAAQLAALLRRLDDAGLVLTALRAKAILICDRPADAPGPVLLLGDYSSLRRHRPRRPHANLATLAQLNAGLAPGGPVTRTDRLRVLMKYLSRLGRPEADWKTAWRRMQM